MSDEKEVRIEKVRENGVIVYAIDSILESAPAKRHLKFLREEWLKWQVRFKKSKKIK